jgi:FHS family Na+ dependent glucose MFS transporter 1
VAATAELEQHGARPEGGERGDFGTPVPLYLTTFLVLGMAAAFLGPALTELRDRSGSDIGSIGRLFAAQAGGYFVGTQLAGRLTDRVNGHHLYAASLAMIATGMALVPQLTSVSSWLPVFVVIGLGTAGVDVGANVMLLWALGPRSGRPMNVLHMMFGVGALAAPLLVYADIVWALRGVALAALLMAAWTLATPAPRPVARRAEHAEATPVLLVTIAIYFCVYVGLEAGFAGWVKTYAEEYRMSDLAATWVVTTFWIGFTGGRLIASGLAHAVRPRVVMYGAAIATVAAAAVLLAGGDATPAIWTGSALMGLSAAPQFPVMFNYLERRIPVTGAVTGWLVGGGALGALCLPFVIGQAIDRTGPAALAVFAVVLSSLALAAFAVTDRTLGR